MNRNEGVTLGRRHDKFRKMFYFLEEMQNKAQSFSLEELAEHTGYKMSSIRTYYGKRLKGVLVEEVRDNTYQAVGIESFDEESFIDYLTQRSSPADVNIVLEDERVGRPPAEVLAESLIARSAASFRGALELYHRPSQGAHLGVAVSLLTLAWELLLRAELVNIRGMQSIEQELEVRALLPKFFPNPRDPVRRNLEWMVRLRDVHVVVLVEEMTPYLSRLLQANVLNFRRRWEAVSECVLFERGGGLMALGIEGRAPDTDEFRKHYHTELAAQMERVLEELSRDEFELQGHTSFQASPTHRLVLSPVIDANQVALSDHHATLEAAERMRHQAHEIWRETHPFTPSEVVHEINRRLPYDLRLTASAIDVIDMAHDVRSAPRSPFYMKLEESPFHVYAGAYVDWVVNAIKERSDWIKRAQEAARRMEE